MAIGAPAVEVAPGILSETARRFFSNRLSVLGLIVILLILFAAVFADFLAPAPRDYAVFKDTLLPPAQVTRSERMRSVVTS